jgi:hypothetical protein
MTSGAGPSIIERAAANIRSAERVSIGKGHVESPSGDKPLDFAFSHASRNFAFALSSVAAVPSGSPPTTLLLPVTCFPRALAPIASHTASDLGGGGQSVRPKST